MKNFLCVLSLLLVANSTTAQCPPTFPDALITPMEVCDHSTNDPFFWNETYWWDAVHNKKDMAEGAADLSLRILDSCQGGPISVRYVLSLDLDGNGSRETIVDSDDFPGWNTVLFNNASSAGTPRQFDARPVLPGRKFGFAMQTTTNGDTLTTAVRWNMQDEPDQYVWPQLPVFAGNVFHKIEWFVTQGSHMQTVSQFFTVSDCAKPVVNCISGLTITILPAKVNTLTDADFLLNVSDNITPPILIQTAIRKTGNGNGFPIKPDGTPQKTVSFNCLQLGSNIVEIWAKDKAGKAGYCTSTIQVEDYYANCGDPISGPICVNAICTDQPMENVSIGLQIITPMGQPTIDLLPIGTTFANGCFNDANLPFFGGFTIQADLKDNPLNGVSTLDMILINKHILGIEPFDEPWKAVAADVNFSKSITTFDIIEIRKLILGVSTNFPNSPSWRFMPSYHSFSTPNPLATPVPFSVPVSSMPVKFYGIKIGDVNCNATPFTNQVGHERILHSIALPECQLTTGQTFEAPLYLPVESELSGFQFALQYDPEKIELIEVRPGHLPGLNEEMFAQPYLGMFTTSWFVASPTSLPSGEALFHFRWRAKVPLQLSEVVRLASAQLHPEMYTSGHEQQDLTLIFGNPKGTETSVIFAPQPNPTGAGTQIAVQCEGPVPAQVELFDSTGRLLFQEKHALIPGLNWLYIPEHSMPQPGIYFWKLRADAVLKTGRLLRF